MKQNSRESASENKPSGIDSVAKEQQSADKSQDDRGNIDESSARELPANVCHERDSGRVYAVEKAPATGDLRNVGKKFAVAAT